MFKSIRTKLILSYFFIIITSMALTGLFFWGRMRQVLVKNQVNEIKSQGEVLSGTISAMASNPEKLITRAELIAQRFSGEGAKILRVFSKDGYLIADSTEENVGYFQPGEDKLKWLLPDTSFPRETKINWKQHSKNGKVYLHNSWSIRGRKGKTKKAAYVGIVDISIPLSENEASDDQRVGQIIERLETIGLQLAAEMEREMIATDKLAEAGGKTIRNEPLREIYRIRIYDTKRYIRANSERMEPGKQMSLRQYGEARWFEKSRPGRILNVGIPIKSNSGKLLGGIVISRSIAFIDKMYLDLEKLLFYAIGISLGVTLVISLLLSRTLVRPITHIKDVARNIARGDFSMRVKYEGHDEISTLSNAINHMAAKIEENIAEITSDKDQINALLSALPDGVVALSSGGNVLYLNSSASQLMNVDEEEAIGMRFSLVWPEKEVEEFFREGIQKDGLFSKEITIPPQILKLYLLPFGKKGAQSGIMLVIRDITDLRRLEETRTHFLGAISHELRTPMTVIKGFIHAIIGNESIQNDDEASKALKIMDKETDRLARLVKDLLELSRLRSRKLSMEMETVNIDDLADETVNQMKPNAERMGIKLTHTTECVKTEMFGDRDRLKQVIINLIDNAIKYTQNGGKVRVNTCRDDDTWFMSVKDNGMGIAKDELPFLFERFFRTRDKKKRKYIKGTGLGMAIVKEIIDAHKGKIKVESKEGEGTTITIKLPLPGKGRA